MVLCESGCAVRGRNAVQGREWGWMLFYSGLTKMVNCTIARYYSILLQAGTLLVSRSWRAASRTLASYHPRPVRLGPHGQRDGQTEGCWGVCSLLQNKVCVVCFVPQGYRGLLYTLPLMIYLFRFFFLFFLYIWVSFIFHLWRFSVHTALIHRNQWHIVESSQIFLLENHRTCTLPWITHLNCVYFYSTLR